MLDQPNIEPVWLTSGREGFRLEAPWTYTWEVPATLETGGLERQLRVTEGFLFDGASVPRILWTLTGLIPSGHISAASLVHDLLYRYRGQLPPYSLFERPLGAAGWVVVEPRKARYSRKTADRLFARIMRESLVRPRQRRLAYCGVRLCGWWAWRRKRAPRQSTVLRGRP